MTGKHIAGILVAACFGAIIAAAHVDVTQQRTASAPPVVTDTPAIIVGGCDNLASGMYVVPLGGTNSICPITGVPLHGVPMPSRGHVRNLRVTGDSGGNALEGTVITVYVNSAPTALSCTVDATGTCQDDVHVVGVRPGNELGATFAATGATGITMSLEVCLSNGVNGC